MRYLLDTNICIYLLNGRYPQLADHLRQVGRDALCVSAVSWTELWHGVARSEQPQHSSKRLESLSKNVDVLPFDAEAAISAGKVIGVLRQAGTPIGPYDGLIAGHALALGLTLVTHNVREFRRVKGLQWVDWTVP